MTLCCILDLTMITTRKQKDLGVILSTNLKVSEQCGAAALKANRILGLIRNIVH